MTDKKYIEQMIAANRTWQDTMKRLDEDAQRHKQYLKDQRLKKIEQIKQYIQAKQCLVEFGYYVDGFCKEPVVANDRCDKHQAEKCSNSKCSNLVTRLCAFSGWLVCGRPHCDNCECGHFKK